MISPQAQNAIGAPLQADDSAVASPDDPPDHGRPPRGSVAAAAAAHADARRSPVSFARSGYPHAYSSHGFSRSWTSASSSMSDQPQRRPSLELTVPVPASPSVADSQSDFEHEHELDSPSSLSSWNSYVGGRRGDLADVEDLELDGGPGCEPELETVSELDEESSSFASGSDRPFPDSEDDDHLHHHHNGQSHNHQQQQQQQRLHYSSTPSPRRKVQAAPPPPTYPHFSPRAGGHGLSHASRYTLRAPPNLAARRKKGRIAELADESGPNDPSSFAPTEMPSSAVGKVEKAKVKRTPSQTSKTSPARIVKDQGSDPLAEQDAKQQQQTHTMAPSQPEAQGSGKDEPGTPKPHSCASSSWSEFEFVGPPPMPARCVSPSETVPAVPSPLSVCLNSADEGEQTAVANQASSNGNIETETSAADETVTIDKESNSPSVLQKSTDATVALGKDNATPSSSSSPPASPVLARKPSRSRRSSSPTRSKPKMPLRPCFRRRASARPADTDSGLSSKRESSSERESSGRGRANKVRFSVAPPQEVRTHSPVEYDRKACPISNRLSPEDVEELRNMKMEMGLLEAKWAAMSACKDNSEHGTDGEESDSSCPSTTWDPRKWKADKKGAIPSSASAPSTPFRDEDDSSNRLSSPSDPHRKRADSIASESPSSMCGSRFAERDSALLGPGGRLASRAAMSPSEHLRMEREKERERACRLAGIGTGVGFRYSGGQSSARQMHHGGMAPLGCQSSLISRFGLSKPPPPLPGTPPTSMRSSPCSGPSSPHDYRSIEEQEQQTEARGRSQSPGTSQSPARSVSAPPVRGRPGTQIQKEEEVAEQDDGDDDEQPRGRSLELRKGPRPTNDSTSTDATVTQDSSSPSSSRSVSTIPSLTHTSPSPDRSSASSSPTRRGGTASFLSTYSPPKPKEPAQVHAPYPTRPSLPPSKVSPLLYKQVPPTPAPLPVPSSCGSSAPFCGGGGCGGYDSPASEFYESGSEYDLIG
ncbi:hypothetical protein FA10DRAFT_268167 [Acaromyces ingoldii]|uniref:Uncharacterized protein n=1 Tax=Acaromyces ingoldii TaxID=215250 RepID=A0A316YK97_9BASI|nr:hypothetical protein FA10DRAFT_268167 [Acaromyces ingoldii]PWN89639.1 hypothetical protein FA10DRAFT_268167 [Acaromyces ingoldii]